MRCFRCSSDVKDGQLARHLIRFCSQTKTANRSEYRVPITFINADERMQLAEDFIVKDKITSLENDVERCLPYTKLEHTCHAPFPALLYCFSVIDLLGSLLQGNATGGDTTCNSRKYMEDYLKYHEAKLIQRIFRHKLVHLSQPYPSVIHDGQFLFWKHDEHNRSKHRTFENKNQQLIHQGNQYPIYEYILSIRSLRTDIKDSVMRKPSGYLDNLANNQDLQNNFDDAINQIFRPL